MLTISSSTPTPIGRWRLFVRRYGWRAYALPILAAITIATLVRGVPAAADHHSAADHRSAADHHPAAPAADGRSRVDVEGRTSSEAAFTRGSSPKPVVISLAADENTCADNAYAQRLIVSIDKQHLWACDGHRQVLQTPVTTGATAHHDATPLGSWRVQGRQRDRYLVGPGYRDYVHYWVPFNGDFGLHDAPWEKTGYGSQDYPTKGSHGCVHVPRLDMKWLYRWTNVGATVVTIEA